ncbi:MAG: selenocysteine-specific translation elongation factor [Anaerolineae bacterium]
MRVIGTAGHVDHGKSTLVHALTGIDPDRLKEEKEREMTIDLGFAWMTLPSGERVGIVDVPGHKDFIKNMLAGVGGIDAALLVVAADEGVMPQTKEHLDILNLLKVKGGVVAITKKDLAEDEELLELVQAELSEELEGTCLAEAPIVLVSAKTGEGLEELVQALDQVLAKTEARRNLGHPRLPIDRVFTISGFGTVVTGTLSDGSFRTGQEVEILPQGLKARIRGLQTHKESIEEAMPGSRVAINLSGVRTDQIKRGDVVTTPGWLAPTQMVDVHLHYLESAPFPLKHNAIVDFFSGAAEIRARVRLLDHENLIPGQTAWAQLYLERPAVLLKGDRFIIRYPSPSLTIGGGAIVNPHPNRRYRRFRPEIIAQLETLAHGSPMEILLQSLEADQPCEVRDLMKRSSLPLEEAKDALNALLAEGKVRFLQVEPAPAITNPENDRRYIISSSGWEKLSGCLAEVLADYHRLHHLRRGMPREELKSRLQERFHSLPARLFNEIVAQAASEGIALDLGEVISLAGHAVRFSPEDERQIEELLSAFRRSPYAPPSSVESEAIVGPEVLAALVEQGRLVRVRDDVLFLKETYEEMVEKVVAHIRENGSITVAQVRDMFRASRKYALALMEHLDERRITKRVGDERVLR